MMNCMCGFDRWCECFMMSMFGWIWCRRISRGNRRRRSCTKSSGRLGCL